MSKFDLEKRALEMGLYVYISGRRDVDKTALQLAREALAAQAEEIAEWCDAMAKGSGGFAGPTHLYTYVAEHVRLIKPWSEPEKTREQELEAALRYWMEKPMAFCIDNQGSQCGCPRCNARRLLEKKP